MTIYVEETLFILNPTFVSVVAEARKHLFLDCNYFDPVCHLVKNRRDFYSIDQSTINDHVYLYSLAV